MVVVKCLAVILLNSLMFGICGIVLKKLTRISLDKGETFLLGFFGYYGFFQIIALPMILFLQPLSLLAKIWAFVTVLLFVTGAWLFRKNDRKWSVQRAERIENKGLLLLQGMLLLLQLYYMFTNAYNGWDTAYYIGNMNTSVITDTMYIYDGSSGVEMGYLNLRYALSSFYVHGSVMCLMADIPVLVYCRYVIPFFGWLISNLIIFKIGENTVGKNNRKYSYMFCVAVCLVNFCFSSQYTTSEFLLTRSSEAKSYCANIIIPMMFLIALFVWNNWEEKTYWVILFFVSFAANAISFSSLAIVPVMVAILCSSLFWVYRKKVILGRGIVCMVMPAIYCIVFYLFAKGYISTVI